MLRTLTLFIVLFGCNSFSMAQIFGGSPPSVKWKQINTPEFRIIFPEGLDSTANKVAENIFFTSRQTLKTIGSKIRKINIVLRNGGLVSNGYVSLGPFRSEFYLTAPANPFELGSTPWPDLLSAHEYRHVQQYANFNVGISHVMKVIFGDEGQALANAATIPDWFFEGDAVYNETNITRQGRGALPYFYNGYRALWASQKDYNWMKLRNGSFLDFIPDKYILGFMMTAYGREKFGVDFWKGVTHDAASLKSIFYPFQSSVKKHSGQNFKDFRDSAFLFFQNQFADASTKFNPPNYQQDEQFAVFDENGNILYLKGSVKDIPRFVIRNIKDGGEKIIRVADYMVEDYFSYRDGRIVYTSRRYNPRWVSQAWNEIQLIKVSDGRQKTITRKTRYFSPDINDAGDKIVAVNASRNGQVSLDLIDVENGNTIQRIAYPGIVNFIHPKFNGENVIAGIVNQEGKMSIAEINTDNKSLQYILPFSDNVIGFPFIRHDTLYFSASQKKKDELMAYTFSDKKLWIVTSTLRGIGKYHVGVSDSLFVWSSFTAQGMRISEVPREYISFNEVQMKAFPLITSSFGLSGLNNINSNLLYRFSDTGFSSKRYRQLAHPFNFHSLEPSVSDPDYTLSLVGENILNTVQSDISFTYNRTDHSKSAGIDVSYGGLYPVITSGYDFSFDRRAYTDSQFVYYNTSEPYVGFYVPMNLSRRRSIRSLSFGSNYRYSYRNIQKPYKNHFKNSSFSYLNNFLSFSNQSQTSRAQVLPRFAQSFYVNYKTPVGNIRGYQYLGIGKLFFPGMGKTNSLNFSVAYSQKDTLNKIGFANSFPFARGYDAANLHKMFGLQANYQLPLFYPDAGFGNIVYLLRIRANVFFDQTSAWDFTSSKKKWFREFRSSGAELFFDTNWWNQNSVSFGIRYSYLFDSNVFGSRVDNRWEIIMPVNLFNK